jgi:DNA-binding transcriptional regulator LsrR (DeoR family)
MNARTAAAIKEIVKLIDEATQPAFVPGLGGMTPQGAQKLETLLHEMAEGIKLDAIEP